MIYCGEQIHVAEGFCPKSACYLIEIDHRKPWHFWTSELQTLVVVPRWEGLPFQDHLPALTEIEMLPPVSGQDVEQELGRQKPHH